MFGQILPIIRMLLMTWGLTINGLFEDPQLSFSANGSVASGKSRDGDFREAQGGIVRKMPRTSRLEVVLRAVLLGGR